MEEGGRREEGEEIEEEEEGRRSETDSHLKVVSRNLDHLSSIGEKREEEAGEEVLVKEDEEEAAARGKKEALGKRHLKRLWKPHKGKGGRGTGKGEAG